VLKDAGLVREEDGLLVASVDPLPQLRTYFDRLWFEASVGEGWLRERFAVSRRLHALGAERPRRARARPERGPSARGLAGERRGALALFRALADPVRRRLMSAWRRPRAPASSPGAGPAAGQRQPSPERPGRRRPRRLRQRQAAVRPEALTRLRRYFRLRPDHRGDQPARAGLLRTYTQH
jgi:hypothetical protein